MNATRERKERFLLSFPAHTHGWPAVRRQLHMYSDAGIDMLVADFIANERMRNKRNAENRRIYDLNRTMADDLMEAAE